MFFAREKRKLCEITRIAYTICTLPNMRIACPLKRCMASERCTMGKRPNGRTAYGLCDNNNNNAQKYFADFHLARNGGSDGGESGEGSETRSQKSASSHCWLIRFYSCGLLLLLLLSPDQSLRKQQKRR